MFKHEKKLMHKVRVEKPNPQYAVLMQEQLGGCNGELKAAMQYLSQSFRAKDPVFKDLLLDIGTEELSHLEIVAECINLLNGGDVDYKKIDSGELETMVTFGLNPALINSSGNPWTADYVTVTGDLAADLLADIASEQRAKVVYEYLYRQIDDKYVKETIMFLLEREEAHNALFCEALNKITHDGSNKNFGISEDSRLYFDLSKPGRYFDDPKPEPMEMKNAPGCSCKDKKAKK
ncbi:manganese catalase family protein [Amedibacillus dolichus]|uniref:manganese catalase family protein n=1 Tax=Amedibacillus dolichus TaxID=31971 RepID=UPI00241CB74B|nr:manganese catalase family protein [Amedibacillus dolichus]